MPTDADPQPLSGRRVLLADDAPDMRDLYRTLLERAGAFVSTCVDGASALAALRSGLRYDAALIDLMMPGSGGMGTAASLRIDGFDGGLVGMSAHLTPETSSYWLAAGCDAVVPKSAPASLLLAAVVDACLRRSSDAT